VLVAPGIAFGMGGWLRICFTAPVAALERGIRVIGDCSALEMSA
jgi:aspartate/methionine/tyrosine aminotransferase